MRRAPPPQGKLTAFRVKPGNIIEPLTHPENEPKVIKPKEREAAIQVSIIPKTMEYPIHST